MKIFALCSLGPHILDFFRLLQLLSTLYLERLVLRGGIAVLGPGEEAAETTGEPLSGCCAHYLRGQAGSEAFFD